MKRTRRPLRRGMRVRGYQVLVRAVEEGTRYGLNRAYKHTDSPSRGALEVAVSDVVINEVCAVFEFDELEA